MNSRQTSKDKTRSNSSVSLRSPRYALSQIEKFQDYIFCLRFRQMPGHIDLDRLATSLPNLTKIDLQYNINKIGMDFDRRLFGMKISDASCLAKSVKDSEVRTKFEI